MKPRRQWLLMLVAGGVLTACASPQALLPQAGSPGRSLSRTGRFVINVREPGSEPQTVQGGFAWLDQGGRLTLDLTTPMGAALARLEISRDGRARLTEADGQVTEAPDADALLRQVVGVAVPVVGLRDWLAGEVSPQPPADIRRRDELGRPLEFEQAGWLLRVTDADEQGPLRLRLSRVQAGQAEIDVRLALQAVPLP